MNRKELQRRRLITKVILVFVICGAGLYAYNRSMKNGLQAEAHLIMSYLSTLINAYQLEHGQLVEFDYYGAAFSGKPQCDQPEGARRLGFVLPWCNGEKSSEPPRYAYRVRIVPAADNRDTYEITARSGSDEHQLSFVCYNENSVDIWRLKYGEKRKHLVDCESE